MHVVAVSVLSVTAALTASAQTVYTYSSSTSSSTWLTPGNWTVNGTTSTKFPGATTASVTGKGTATDIAAFGAIASGVSPIAINFNTAGGELALGAIDFLSTSTRSIAIGDNSTTAASATLTLNGQTLNGVANTILSNEGSYGLTLQPTAATGAIAMTVALGNATNNVVQINGSGGLAITSIVKDRTSPGQLTLAGTGSGNLNLSAANTYTGGTVVAAGKLVVSNTTGSATGAGNVAVGNNTGVAVLAGTGIVTGAVTTASTGTNVAYLAPGTITAASNFGSAGTLRLNGGLSAGAGTNFSFDLAGTTTGASDLITLGSSTLSLGNAVTFNFNLLNTSLATSGAYTLLSGAANTPDLSGVTFTTNGLGGNYTAAYSASGGSLLVTFTATTAGNYFGTTGQGVNAGSTVFDTTTQDFNTRNDGTGTAKAYDSTQVAVFGGTGGAVTVASGGVTVGAGLQFDATGYVLSGGTLTLSASGVQVTNSGDTATLASALTGAAGLTKTGAGRLVLTGANTISGTFTNSAGTLEFNNGVNALSALTVNAGTVQVDAGSQVTLTSGTSLTIASGATLTINGTLLNNSTSALPTPGGTVTVAAGGTVIQQGNGSPSNFLTSANTTFQPGSTFVFRDYTLTPSVSGRTYTGNLVFDNSGTANTVGAISGAGAWTVNGNLTVGAGTSFDYGTYTGTTTFGGNVTVNGTLGANNGARSFTVASGKTLSVGAAGVLNVAAGQTLTIASGGTAQGTGTITGTTVVNGTLAPGTAGTTGTLTVGALTLAASSTLAFDLNTATSKDLVALSGNALALNGGTLALNLPNTTATGIDYTATYTLLSGVGSLAGSGFGTVTGYDSTDYAPVFNLNGTSYNLSFVAVPEPATVLGGLLLVGASGWHGRRRVGRWLRRFRV